MFGPTWLPKSSQNPSKINPKLHRSFGWFFDRRLIDLWLNFSRLLGQQIHKNQWKKKKPATQQHKVAELAKTSKKHSAFICFCYVSHVLLYPVCIKNGSQNDLEIDDKIDDFLAWFFDGLGVYFQTNLASKLDQKAIKKLIQKMIRFLIDVGSLLGRFWKPSWFQNPSKIDQKPTCKLDQNFHACLQLGGSCKSRK